MTSIDPHIAAALLDSGIPTTRIASIVAVSSDHRNDVHLVSLRNPAVRVIVKLQTQQSGFQPVAHEADVLTLMRSHSGLPRLIAAGRTGRRSRPFLITEMLHGIALDSWLSRDEQGTEGQLGSYAAWLHAFSRSTAPLAALRLKATGFIGPWSISYHPDGIPLVDVGGGPDAGAAPYEVTNLHRVAVVHGSFDPKNILVANDATAHLSGVVDFEATRLGSPLIDIAGLALHFLLWRRVDLARAWTNAAATTWNWPLMARDTMPYLVAQHQRRLAAADADPAVRVASRRLTEDFVAWALSCADDTRQHPSGFDERSHYGAAAPLKRADTASGGLSRKPV